MSSNIIRTSLNQISNYDSLQVGSSNDVLPSQENSKFTNDHYDDDEKSQLELESKDDISHSLESESEEEQINPATMKKMMLYMSSRKILIGGKG